MNVLLPTSRLIFAAPCLAPEISARPLVDEDRGIPPAPVDYGYGPNVKPPFVVHSMSTVSTAAADLVARIGGSYALIEAAFGPAVTWPATCAIAVPDPGRA